MGDLVEVDVYWRILMKMLKKICSKNKRGILEKYYETFLDKQN
jgi:hypothetical protein